MNITQQGIITLLKSAITRQTLPLPEGFSLEEAYPVICKHHMVTLSYDGAVRCGISPKDSVMGRLFSGYCKALLISERQMEQVARVTGAFDENGIDYMPLKGCKMKALYPVPELRIMGDADILIRLSQYDKITPVMKSLGFTEKSDTDHELTWTGDGLYLELHKRLIPSYNKDYFAYFGDGWQRAKREANCRFSMSAEDEWIYLFTHFAKHYRDGGIGCRHVVDLWVYLQAHRDLDTVYLEQELMKLRLLTFHQNVRRLMEVWFADAPADEVTDHLTDYIFASGSYGRTESHALSQTVRDSGAYRKGVSVKLIYFLERMFPRAKTLEGDYKILRKAPWLLPLIWIHRWFYKAIFQRNSLRRELRNLQAVERSRVEERRRELEYVGLEYYF